MTGYTKDASAEVNKSFEYVGKSFLLLKRYSCEQHDVFHNIDTPISSNTPC